MQPCYVKVETDCVNRVRLNLRPTASCPRCPWIPRSWSCIWWSSQWGCPAPHLRSAWRKEGGGLGGVKILHGFLKRRHLWIFAPTLFLKIYPAMAAANSTRMIRPRRMANCGEKNLMINNYYGDKRWAKKIKSLITINLKTEVEQKVSRAFGTNRTISIENTAPCCPLNTPALILCRTIKID